MSGLAGVGAAAGPGPVCPGSSSSLLDQMERAAVAGDGTVHLVAAGEHVRWSELWDEAHSCAGWLAEALPDDRVLAGLLEPSRACLVTLLGAWLAGRTFASLPHPSRGMGADEYRHQVAGLVELVEATVVVVPPGFADVEPGTRVLRYPDVGRRRPVSGSDEGRLVQFTSGSTDRPRGVSLDMGRLGANASAMAASVGVRPGDVFFSWLPLSHDMGLVGMCLAPAASLSPELGGASHIWLSVPVRFVRNPLSWLRLAGDVAGTITAAPTFALDLVSRRLARGRHGGLDLSSLRCLIVGSEMVDPGVLQRFASVTAPHGLREEALCPAYGLAEATLAVTIVRPGAGWKTFPDPAGAAGDVETAAPSSATDPLAPGTPLPSSAVATGPVALGLPVPGTEVRAGRGDRGGAEPAEIEVRAPSVAGELLGRPGSFTDDGWLRTGDLGFLHERELYFTGRADDRIVVRGRNLDAGALQRRLGQVDGVRPGCCVVVQDVDNRPGYAAVFEAAAASGDRDLRELCRIVASVATRWSGTAPHRVIAVGRGAIPKTPSGKPQPHRLRAALTADAIVPLVELVTRSGGL